MAIIVNVDVMLAKRNARSRELVESIGITEQNVSIFKTGKAKAIRFTALRTLGSYLHYQPGNILRQCRHP